MPGLFAFGVSRPGRMTIQGLWGTATGIDQDGDWVSGTADEVLGNRYRLIAPVGTGGMAVVWRAQDLVLDRDVAIKLLAEELANKPGNRERIRAEAQVVARLQHPNITAVHDYGEAGDAFTVGRHGRRPYVVMELLEGELLSNRLRSGPMSWRRATQICAQVAAGLAAAHERHVVHRDIKPSNIMLTAAGAKILDFGVAGLTGSFDPRRRGRHRLRHPRLPGTRAAPRRRRHPRDRRVHRRPARLPVPHRPAAVARGHADPDDRQPCV